MQLSTYVVVVNWKTTLFVMGSQGSFCPAHSSVSTIGGVSPLQRGHFAEHSVSGVVKIVSCAVARFTPLAKSFFAAL